MGKLSKGVKRFLTEEVQSYFRTPDKKPYLVQLSEMKKLFQHYRFPPYHYVKHELYLQSFTGDLTSYVPPALLRKYRDSMNPKEHHIKVINKDLFTSLLTNASLPTVANLATILRNGEIILPDERSVSYKEFLDLLLETGNDEIFLKPKYAGGGIGLYTAKIDGGKLIIDDASVDEQELSNLLYAKNTLTSYIVQPHIKQHPLLDKMNPSSVNTVRIDTMIIEDEVINNFAVLKIGSGFACGDNWANGSYACGINMLTGELLDEGVTKAKNGRKKIKAHPVTGFVLKGTRLPYWEELKDLVASAAREMLPLKCLGWDVAITEQGPVIIEANQDYGIFMMQDRCGGLRGTPLGENAIKSLRNHHAR